MGGDHRYSSIFGKSPKGCYSVCLSDTAVALTAPGAEVETSKKRLPMENFSTKDARSALGGNELLTGIRIPGGEGPNHHARKRLSAH